MYLEAHGGISVFLAPFAEQKKFVFELDCVFKRKYFVFHNTFPMCRVNLGPKL
jgi:hypothetical protein